MSPPSISHTNTVVGETSRRLLSCFSPFLRCGAQPTASSRSSSGRSESSARRRRKGLRTRCWFRTSVYFPCSGKFCTCSYFAGKSPAMAPAMMNAPGAMRYLLAREERALEEKAMESPMKRLLVGMSSISSSTMHRPNEPSIAALQRSKCSTKEKKMSTALIGLPSLSRCMKSPICALAYSAPGLSSAGLLAGATYARQLSWKART
mmetsp:Transcript_39187/g.122183  ORF Transcript_39187/g.122183 Transcript_39187/m.122183 type:complete len:206 (-) Transcript_39187:160-777(-)